MSYKRLRKSIPPKTARKLWIIAGGRCQYLGCNCELWKDSLTRMDINKAYISHIVAASPNGPRGDSINSGKLETDIDNLMLLCDECHNRIDEADKDNHTIDLLREMKFAHEERIRRVTGVTESQRSAVVTYLCKIGDFHPTITKLNAFRSILPAYFPAFDYMIEGGAKNPYIEDHLEEYWKLEATALEVWVERKVKSLFDSKDCSHLSVFALAPQPLLIKLGTLIPDLIPACIYQYFRDPSDSWVWKDVDSDIGANLIHPLDTTGLPVLILAISAPVNHTRITSLFPNEKLSIWEVTIESPARDCIKSKQHLQQIKETFRKAFDSIKMSHPSLSLIHVFPVMPNSAAVEFGRARMQKADLSMVLYDQNNKYNSFKPSIKIN